MKGVLIYIAKRRKYNEFDLETYKEEGTAILIYENEKYLFDIEDYEKIKLYYWKSNDKGYLTHWQASFDENGKRKSKYIYFHKFILGLNDSPNKVDHIDRNNHNNKNTKITTKITCNKISFKTEPVLFSSYILYPPFRTAIY